MPLLNADNMVKYSLVDENPTALQNAIDALNKGEVSLVGFSGKKGSGKDTLAEIFKSNFERDHGPASFSPFAAPLKGEATSIIHFLWAWVHNNGFSRDKDALLSRLGTVYNLNAEQARNIFDLMVPAIKTAHTPFDGWTRTEEVWTLLRTLGTDIRQPQDKIYWVRRTIHSIVSNANNGISTIVQDARFLHEVEALRDIGAYVARVDIDPLVQLQRLATRDGVTVDEAAQTHSSETQLDDYEYFDIRVDNSADGKHFEAAEKIYADWSQKTNK